MKRTSSSGITLLELLVVIGILAIISSIGAGYFRGFSRNMEMSSSSKNIVSQLKNARAKSMNGEEDMKWGVIFINGASDYFEMYSTPTDYSDPGKTIKEIYYLPNGVNFSRPTEGLTTDILFDKVYGSTTPAEIVLYSEGQYSTTSVKTNGNIN